MNRPTILRNALRAACLVGTLVGVAPVGAQQVVADSACLSHAEDIASFATCEGDKVAPALHVGPVSEISAARAVELLREARGAALFVDVRSWHEVAFVGRAEGLDAVVPFQEVDAVIGDPQAPTVRMRRTPEFASRIAALLADRVLADDATIVLICRSGERSRDAARELMQAGYRNVHSVKDGFEGPLAKQGPDQDRRVVAGWRHAGLPWQQRTAR